MTEITRYAETSAHRRASKHLPSADELHVNIKNAGNELLWKMLEDPALKEQFAIQKPELLADKDLIRNTYQHLVETPEYKTYINHASRD